MNGNRGAHFFRWVMAAGRLLRRGEAPAPARILPADPHALPRKVYNDKRDVGRKCQIQTASPLHRMIPKAWWALIAGGGLAGLALGVAAAYLRPNAYTAEVRLRIEQPKIPGNLPVPG